MVQLPQMDRVFAYGRQRDLVRPPGALHREAVDLGRSGPALGGAQHDHRPPRAFGDGGTGAFGAGGVLEGGDAVQGLVHGAGHRLVDGERSEMGVPGRRLGEGRPR